MLLDCQCHACLSFPSHLLQLLTANMGQQAFFIHLPSHLAQLLQGFVHILLEGTWLWFPKLMQNKEAHMWIYELCEWLLSPD